MQEQDKKVHVISFDRTGEGGVTVPFKLTIQEPRRVVLSWPDLKQGVQVRLNENNGTLVFPKLPDTEPEKAFTSITHKGREVFKVKLIMLPEAAYIEANKAIIAINKAREERVSKYIIYR